MEQMPDLGALRALVLVAETGSINAASSRMEVTQQAVSLRIRSLEARLGTPLLVRSRRGSTLTPAGQLVAGWATQLLSAADDFQEAVDSLHRRNSERFCVAASLTIAEHLVPEWIARWRVRAGSQAPEVTLVAANSHDVAQLVRSGDAELGFVETTEPPSDLGSAVIGWDDVVVVVSPAHPWARRTAITAAELARTALVLREPGSGTRESLESALRDAGHPREARPAAVLSTTLGIRSTIAAGMSPGALSALAVRSDIDHGRVRLVPVEGLRIARPLTAVWSGPRPSRVARDLLESVPVP